MLKNKHYLLYVLFGVVISCAPKEHVIYKKVVYVEPNDPVAPVECPVAMSPVISIKCYDKHGHIVDSYLFSDTISIDVRKGFCVLSVE